MVVEVVEVDWDCHGLSLQKEPILPQNEQLNRP